MKSRWFRSQNNYNSGGWCDLGCEGGGLLTNQCPHNIDMYQWLFGVPVQISGHANIGKYHAIEVEDEVTAYFEHDNCMIGHFIANTGETPGTNRLEIIGENGKLILENGKLTFIRNRMSMFKFLKETPESFASLESWYTEIPFNADSSNAHKKVTEKFVDAILMDKTELIAHGTEGINSVAIANAIMLSSFSNKPIQMPLDSDEYENKLKELIKTSRYIKTTNNTTAQDMSNSFSK